MMCNNELATCTYLLQVRWNMQNFSDIVSKSRQNVAVAGRHKGIYSCRYAIHLLALQTLCTNTIRIPIPKYIRIIQGS